MGTDGSHERLKDVINFDRCSNFGSILPLILYLPIGMFLGLIRCFIFLHVCLLYFVLPQTFPLKRWILRAMLTVVGLPVTTQGKPWTDKRKIIIANYVSNLDPFILALLHPFLLVLENPSQLNVKNVPSKLFQFFELPSDKDRSDVIKIFARKVEESEEPILLFPEKVRTNGSSGVLKLSSLPFEVDFAIQPVTIQPRRFLFDVNISTFSSSAMEDLFWCLVLPFTVFNIKYLPVTEKKKDETNEEFACRVQANMSKSMNVQPISSSYTDIIEYVKERNRLKNDKIKTSAANHLKEGNSPRTADSLEFEKMVLQVQDVLPDALISRIETELRKTRDVDSTITNILEGKAGHVPEKTSEIKHMPEGQSFKASKFEQNAKARQMSFAERKEAMYESARLQYRKKHGL